MGLDLEVLRDCERKREAQRERETRGCKSGSEEEMRSGERREGGAARRYLLPAHWLWWGQEQSWTLFCTIYQPLLLPKELNCIEKHRALIRAGQLGRKIYHPNYQRPRQAGGTVRAAGGAGGVLRGGASGLARVGSAHALSCPHSSPVEVGGWCPSLSLGDNLSGIICSAFPRRLETLT